MNEFELKALENELQKMSGASIKVVKAGVKTEMKAAIEFTYLKGKYHLNINVVTEEREINITRLLGYISRKIQEEEKQIEALILSPASKIKEGQLFQPVYIRFLTCVERQIKAYCRFNKIDYSKTSIKSGYISNKLKDYIDKGLTRKQALEKLKIECDPIDSTRGGL